MEDARPGHAVEFHGLKGAAHLNGTRGHLVKFLKKEQRWAVRCDDEEAKLVNAKPENLKRIAIVSPPSGSGASDGPFADPMLNEMWQERLQERQNAAVAAPPEMITSSSHGDANSLHQAVLDSYHKRRKGGAVVFFGSEFVMAVEFFGPYGNGGASVEMVYVDRDPNARAVAKSRQCSAKELGRNFLLGETTEFIEATDEGAFFSVLRKYQQHAKSQGNIDLKSGLKLYKTRVSA